MILNLDRLSMARVGGPSCSLLLLERGVDSGAVLVMNNNCNRGLRVPFLGGSCHWKVVLKAALY